MGIFLGFSASGRNLNQTGPISSATGKTPFDASSLVIPLTFGAFINLISCKKVGSDTGRVTCECGKIMRGVGYSKERAS